MTVVFQELFNGGDDGVTLTTSNTNFTDFNGSGSAEFDVDLSVEGCRSGLFLEPRQAHGLVSAGGEFYLSEYVYFHVASIGNFDFNLALDTDSIQARCQLANDGRFRLVDGNTVVTSTTHVMVPEQWYRIEWTINAATGTQDLLIFTGAELHTTTPTESHVGATYSGSATIDEFTYSRVSAGAIDMNIDRIILDDAVMADPLSISIWDSYTDTDGTLLSAHTPDSGGTITDMDYAAGGAAVGNTAEINNNRFEPPNVAAQTAIHRYDADPGEDEYDLTARMEFNALAQTFRYHALCWRMSPTGTSNAAVDRYLLFADGDATQEWQLYKIVGGTVTLLDSQADTLAGNVFCVRVEVRNGSMSVFVDDGTGEVLAVSSTDADITQRGRVGVGGARGGTDHWLDDLSVTPIAAAGPVSIEAQPGVALPQGQLASLTVELEIDAYPGAALPHGQTATLSLATQINATPATSFPQGQIAELTFVEEVGVDGLPGIALPVGQVATLDGTEPLEIIGRPLQPTADVRPIQGGALERPIQPIFTGSP